MSLSPSLPLHMQTESVFSEEEIEKLQGSLGLESQDLELLLETTVFIFQQVRDGEIGGVTDHTP